MPFSLVHTPQLAPSVDAILNLPNSNLKHSAALIFKLRLKRRIVAIHDIIPLKKRNIL